MGWELTAVLLDGGRELNVELVAGANEFLATMLGDASLKSGPVSLQAGRSAVGQPVVSILLGDNRVGFLCSNDAHALLPTLAICEQRGAVAQARAVVVASPHETGRVELKISLPEPDQLLDTRWIECAQTTPLVPRGDAESRAVQAEMHCPRCGAPRPQQSAVCQCGYIFDYGATVVVEDKIIGRSPMVLPFDCILCGKAAADGRRISETLYAHPGWVRPVYWFGGGWLGTTAYICSRKPLKVSYSLCYEHARSRRNKKWICVGAWLLPVLLLVVGSVVGLHGGLALSAFLILSFVALVATVAARQSPLERVRYDYDHEVFVAKGAGKSFLAKFGRYAGQHPPPNEVTPWRP